MKQVFIFSILLSIALYSVNGFAADVERGQLLYQNHCGKCHTAAIHQRENSKVKNLVDLSTWVIRWQYHLKLNWEMEDVRHVMAYLNEEYYHIALRP